MCLIMCILTSGCLLISTGVIMKPFKLMKRIGENTAFMDGPEYQKVRVKQSAEYGKLVKEMTGR